MAHFPRHERYNKLEKLYKHIQGPVQAVADVLTPAFNAAYKNSVEREKIANQSKLSGIQAFVKSHFALFGYKSFAHCLSTSGLVFFFIKYMDATISSKTEFKPYVGDPEWYKDFAPVANYDDTYPFDDCPNKTHNPTLFTWLEVKYYCTRALACDLPVFVSREDQERFLELLQIAQHDAVPIFPVDAVYIGLIQKPNKVTIAPWCSVL